ncbi:unnamed protein product [Brachionus calyciflorus]|uniref:Uncharacterized protein n=1 Tax=Brachionus calyciflorus TaxID=104777 RepID=A0A814QVI5_9BILA|nr:unnamed protein product [Brachionus calyciflorus]
MNPNYMWERYQMYQRFTPRCFTRGNFNPMLNEIQDQVDLTLEWIFDYFNDLKIGKCKCGNKNPSKIEVVLHCKKCNVKIKTNDRELSDAYQMFDSIKFDLEELSCIEFEKSFELFNKLVKISKKNSDNGKLKLSDAHKNTYIGHTFRMMATSSN